MSYCSRQVTDEVSVDRQDSHDESDRVSNYANNAPIGIFDSGIGGLSVYRHLAEQLPAEHYIYYADTLHVPYGNRTSQDIEHLTLQALEWLYQRGCKLIVIACNSASAYALTIARLRYPQITVVGLVPALKPAVLNSQSHHVAVLATKATLEGPLLNQVIDDIAHPNATRVTKHFDPDLVPWVEAGMPNESMTATRLRRQLKQFADDNVDYLVLGCTHYPFFKHFLLTEINEQQLALKIVDSGEAIATRVKHLLVDKNLLASAGEAASSNTNSNNDKRTNPLTFYASKYDDQLVWLVERLIGESTAIQYLV